VTASLAYNKNKVVDIPNDEGIIHGPSSVLSQGTTEMFRAQTGYPVGYFWGFETAGIFQDSLEAVNWVGPTGEPYFPKNQKAGDIRFVDQNNDGQINTDDKVMIGDPNPDYVFGLQISAEYKGVYLQATGNGQAGHQIAKSYRSFADSYQQNYTTDVYNRWHGPGTSNKMPRLVEGTHRNNQNISDIYIENGDFFRINNITLGYDLKNLIKKMSFPELKIYVSGQNIYTFTKYSGMDPEVAYAPEDSQNKANDFSWGSGIDLGFYPACRTYLVGLSVKF
jgi:hypothetical protein